MTFSAALKKLISALVVVALAGLAAFGYGYKQGVESIGRPAPTSVVATDTTTPPQTP